VGFTLTVGDDGLYVDNFTPRGSVLIYPTADCSGPPYAEVSQVAGNFAAFSGGTADKLFRPSGASFPMDVRSFAYPASPCTSISYSSKAIPLTVVSNSTITIQGPISVR
jgi:hypothetical protein